MRCTERDPASRPSFKEIVKEVEEVEKDQEPTAIEDWSWFIYTPFSYENYYIKYHLLVDGSFLSSAPFPAFS